MSTSTGSPHSTRALSTSEQVALSVVYHNITKTRLELRSSEGCGNQSLGYTYARATTVNVVLCFAELHTR